MSEAMRGLEEVWWSRAQLGQALAALVDYCGWQQQVPGEDDLSEAGSPPPEMTGPAGDERVAVGSWLTAAAGRLGVDVEPVSTTYDDVEQLLRDGGPAILRLPAEDGERYGLLVGARGDAVTLLAPDGECRQQPLESVRAALAGYLEERLAPDVEQMLATVGVAESRRPGARRALLSQRLGSRLIAAGWLLRLPPGAGAGKQVRQTGLLRYLFTFVGAYTIQHLLFLLSWWVIGRAALQQRMEAGWFWSWLLILLTIVPFRLLFTRAQGLLALQAGARLKQRLLAGVLRLEPDEVRHQGVGHLLGRVVESEAIESLALRGGFLGAVAVIEVVVAAFVLAVGAGGGAHVLLLLVWSSLVALLAWRTYRRRVAWTESRLEMTHDLVEQMVGHRTRLVQEAPEERHRAEDEALARYVRRSREMDAPAVLLTALVPRGWLLLGLVGLVPTFVMVEPPVDALAVALGGVLLALRALTKLARSLADLAGAAIAWRQVSDIYQAAARPLVTGEPDAVARLAKENGDPLLRARSVVFSYPEQSAPALRPCDFQIGREVDVLLQGPSGGGKSTLAALLGGLREPTAGTLRLYGLERQAVGADLWRQSIAVAPQFDENHVLTGTVSFNLLMGRRWPADPEDLREAEALCHELGLGRLLAEMPAGLHQMVGESGWQLSHGERTRLYLARALLQNARLVVLDECFAALDPDNLREALRVARRRAQALVVIAHP